MKDSHVSFMVILSRENAKDARKADKRQIPDMASWYRGRSGAFMVAARMISGTVSAKTRNFKFGKKAA